MEMEEEGRRGGGGSWGNVKRAKVNYLVGKRIPHFEFANNKLLSGCHD